MAIHVTFLDSATGKHIAHSEMPPDHLPDSFEAETTLEIQARTYRVVSAKPMTKPEFVELGRLTIELLEIQTRQVDPGEILYTLPTISEDLPLMAPGSTKLKKSVLEMHEDDWRQVECVHRTFRPELKEQLRAIARIYDEQREPMGAFREIHVRKLIPQPLPGEAIDVDTLIGVLAQVGAPQLLEGIAIEKAAGLIEHGFAIRHAAGPIWYGIAIEGRVVVLGLHGANTEPLDEAVRAPLAALCERFELDFVDWVRAAAWEPGPGGTLRRIR
jgi:hypothetical protein